MSLTGRCPPQVGRTRILYRSPVHRRLELERTVAVERLLVRLQAHVRRWQAQGAVRRWRVVLRDPIRAAVRARDLPALTAALEPATALAQRFPFRELIEARAARARLVDLADLHRELERVRALDPERHYDAYLAACEWADRLGERSAPCDAVRQRLEQVRRRARLPFVLPNTDHVALDRCSGVAIAWRSWRRA